MQLKNLKPLYTISPINDNIKQGFPKYIAPRMGKVNHIHFVGIGGVGMCGIAEVLYNEGYIISGSDLFESKVTLRLKSLGIKVFIGHIADNIIGADVVVRSSAICETNPEIVAAKASLVPVIPRAMMLAELMRFRHGIAIAGTHGKTTTTSLVSSLLAEGKLDPSYVIGGKLNSSGMNAKLGESNYFVAEADESDASFLYLKPLIAVVTNIDADHMETYNNDFDKLRATFIEFLHHLPFYGFAVLCVDDCEIQKIIPKIQRKIITYGFDDKAQFKAINYRQDGMSSEFEVIRPLPNQILKVKFNYPGKHNVLNSLAAIAVATELGVSDEDIIQGLANFQGVGRRFQILGPRQFSNGEAIVVDDYGHHPNEIKTTVDALRRVWPDKRFIHVFQPHRFTRTKALFKEFVEALSLSDIMLLMDIYPAGEEPIENVNSKILKQSIENNGAHVLLVNENTLEEELNKIIKDGDVVLMQGAGSIGQMALKFFQNLI